jgi:hypothetical protein
LWWTSILNLLSGGIADKVLDGYKAKLDQGTNADKLAADLASKEIEARQRIAVAELGSWFTALPRVTIEMTVAVYIAKVIVWDKVFAMGSTDAITGAVGGWVDLVVIGMFGTAITSRVVGGLMKR